MSPRPPVRIAGLGAITALGADLSQLMSGLFEGRIGFGRPRGLELPETPFPLAEVDLAPSAGTPRALLFAERAAREAVREAGWSGAELASPSTLLVFATTKAGLDVAEAALERRVALERVQDSLLFQIAPALADRLGMAGPRLTVSLACASGLSAVGLARSALIAGEVDRALVVGADAATAFVYRGFASLQALDPEGARPFDVGRAGLTLGEGAGAVALEAGPGPLEIVGYGASNDANHITGPARDGRGLVAALQAALHEADVRPAQVGFGILHGTATLFNDRMEGVAYGRVFGPHRLPSLSLKGAIGHLLGAAGLVNLAVTAVSLRDGRCPPSAGLRDRDPEIELDVVCGSARVLESELAVTSASGFAGVNAAAVLRRRPGTTKARSAEPRAAHERGRLDRAVLTALVDAPTDRASLIAQIGSRSARRLDELSLLVVGALQSALEAAGLDPAEVGAARHALVLGTGLGCLEADYAFFEAARAAEEAGPSPRLFAYTLPNIALGEAAIRFGLSGENLVLAAGRASAFTALAAGSARVSQGESDIVVVIAADAVGAATARLMASQAASPRARAAAFVLESPAWAAARGGPVRGEISGRWTSPEPGRPGTGAALAATADTRAPSPDDLGASGLDPLFAAVASGEAGRWTVGCPSGHAAEVRFTPRPRAAAAGEHDRASGASIP